MKFLPDALEDFLLRLFKSFPLAPGQAIGFAAHDVVDEGHGIPDDLIEVAGDLLAQVSGGRFQVDGKIEGMPVGDHFPNRLRRGPDVFLPGLEPIGGNLGSALIQHILGRVGDGDLPPGQGVGKFIEKVGQMIAQSPFFRGGEKLVVHLRHPIKGLASPVFRDHQVTGTKESGHLKPFPFHIHTLLEKNGGRLNRRFSCACSGPERVDSGCGTAPDRHRRAPGCRRPFFPSG